MNEDVLRRIERLERHNRLLLGLLLTCSLGLGVVLLTGAASRVPERLVVRSLAVVGEDGKNSALLGASDDGWVTLSLQDLAGVQRAALMLTPDGKPTFALFNQDKARLMFGIVDGPRGEEFSFQLRDRSGKLVWQPNIPNAF